MTSENELRPDTILRQSADYTGLANENHFGSAQGHVKLHHWIWNRMNALADVVTAGTEPQKHH